MSAKVGSCTQTAAEVCHKVQVVVHDPQGASKGVLGGLALGFSIVGFR